MEHNLFVDESCHLEHDHFPVMCIGYVKVPKVVYEKLWKDLTCLKLKHNSPTEIKWNKISKSRLPLYKAFVDFFFDTPIEFRCILIKHKERLRNNDFNQGEHDNFYYKMTYYLLRPNPVGEIYRVFMDIKDGKGKEKLLKIGEVFDKYHHGASPFSHFQHIRSHDNVFFQMADLFIGAVTFKARYPSLTDHLNPTKVELINYLEQKLKYSIDVGTPEWETKFNIFDFQPQNKE